MSPIAPTSQHVLLQTHRACHVDVAAQHVTVVPSAACHHVETFVYNFVTETAGTYWWHSHHHAQYMDGLLGSLIVMEPTEVKYASDQVVFVQDW
jgi:FtsP/CotA-like multicopper oxidase with cupredoxin domain